MHNSAVRFACASH